MKESTKGRKLKAAKVALIIFLAVSLGFLLVSTDVYKEVQEGTVEILCMSCSKLQYKTSADTDYTFETANGQPHPDFVVDNLENGPVFLHFSESACPGCEKMLPAMQSFFKANFEKENLYSKKIDFEGLKVTYFYIYRSNSEIPEKYRKSWKIYDKKGVKGFPMFTIVTRGYHHSGEVKPYYLTIYGAFGDTDSERMDFLDKILTESVNIYKRNTP